MIKTRFLSNLLLSFIWLAVRVFKLAGLEALAAAGTVRTRRTATRRERPTPAGVAEAGTAGRLAVLVL